MIEERLEKEKEYNPMKILGLPLTMNIIQIINTSLLTLAGAMINKRTSLLN